MTKKKVREPTMAEKILAELQAINQNVLRIIDRQDRNETIQKIQAEQIHHLLKLGNIDGLHYTGKDMDNWWKRLEKL